MVASNEKERLQTYPALTKETSAKHSAIAPVPSSKSGPLSPTSNKRRPSLVIDTKDDAESERNYGDTIRTRTPTQLVSPTSAAISKLITNTRNNEKKAGGIDKKRLQTYQTSAKKQLSAIQLVNSKYGVTSPPKSKPNLVIDTTDDTTSGSLPAELSPQISPSLFQQSANKVGLLQRSFSGSECSDYHGEQGASPAAAFSRLNIGPTSPMSTPSSGTDHVDKTAARVSNFIDSLHQKRGITSTPRGAGNVTFLPPKSPSVARLATSNNRYSSILSNARSVIASSPVSKAYAAAASKGSPQTAIAIAHRKSFLQKSAVRRKALDSDSSDSSDDDSSYSSDSSFSSNEAPASTKKDVADFIDTLKRKNEPKVTKDMELLSSLKAKLNTRKSEKETAAKKNREILHSFKAQLGAQEKPKSDPSGTEEKKVETAEIDTPMDYASKHNIKKDVNYYAVLTQIQKAVQSDNPALLMGKILADAGKRGMKLAMVTEMIKEEKLKAKACKAEKVETGASVEKETTKKNVTKVCVLAKEQTKEQSVEKAEDVENKQSTADIDVQNAAKPRVPASPPKAQPAPSNSSSKDEATTSNPSDAPSAAGKESESDISSVNIMSPPTQEDVVNANYSLDSLV